MESQRAYALSIQPLARSSFAKSPLAETCRLSGWQIDGGSLPSTRLSTQSRPAFAPLGASSEPVSSSTRVVSTRLAPTLCGSERKMPCVNFPCQTTGAADGAWRNCQDALPLPSASPFVHAPSYWAMYSLLRNWPEASTSQPPVFTPSGAAWATTAIAPCASKQAETNARRRPRSATCECCRNDGGMDWRHNTVEGLPEMDGSMDTIRLCQRGRAQSVSVCSSWAQFSSAMICAAMRSMAVSSSELASIFRRCSQPLK